jgi:hypothetical protein
MARGNRASGRVIGEVADLTGRSDAEVRLLLGGALAVGALGLVLSAVRGLVELGASFARHAGGPR